MSNEQPPQIMEESIFNNVSALQTLEGITISKVEGSVIEFNHTFTDYTKMQDVIKNFDGFDALTAENDKYNSFQVDLTKINNELQKQQNELAVLQTKKATIEERNKSLPEAQQLAIPDTLTNDINRATQAITKLQERHTKTTERMFSALLKGAPEETQAQLLQAMQRTDKYAIVGNRLATPKTDENGVTTYLAAESYSINGEEITIDENGVLSIVTEETIQEATQEKATSTKTNNDPDPQAKNT